MEKKYLFLIVGGFLIIMGIGTLVLSEDFSLKDLPMNFLPGIISAVGEDAENVELLIKTSDNVLSKEDTVKWTQEMRDEHQRGNYRQGYIVTARPEGWNWGSLELDSRRFAIVTIPIEDYNETWLEPEYDYDKPIFRDSPEIKDSKPEIVGYEIKTRRKYRLPLEEFMSTEEITDVKNLPYNSISNQAPIKKIVSDVDSKIELVNFDELPNLWVSHGSAGYFTMCEAGSPTCDYSSISAFEAGEQADLIGNGKAELNITGNWDSNDTTTVGIDGWTCDDTNYVEIYVDKAYRHQGNFTDNVYALVPSATRGLFSREQHTVINGLQIVAPAGEGVYFLEATNHTVKNCYLENRGVRIAGFLSYGYVNVYNNIIHADVSDRSILIDDAETTAYVYSNTIYSGVSVGIYASSGVTYAKNNIVEATSNYDYYGNGFHSDSDYNVAEDTTTTGGSNDKPSTTCTFTNEAGLDFHLDTSDTNCKDSGMDLSADENLSFSDDIDGDSRTGTWDIGADEIPEVVGDTCIYSGSGDHTFDMEDYCNITTPTNFTGIIDFTGTFGYLNISVRVNTTELRWPPDGTTLYVFSNPNGYIDITGFIALPLLTNLVSKRLRRVISI